MTLSLASFPATDELPFADIRDLVADDLKAVNQALSQALQSTVSLIPQLGQYLIAAGGKRIRPLVMLLVSKMCGDQASERIISLAACLEFIHAATLLHDDVVDESPLRRGLQTANSLWGNKASVLVGDFLFARAFQLMVADKSLEVLRILSNASAQIVEGEVNQLEWIGNLEVTVKDYFKVIESKTAPLFKAAAMVGACVNNQSPQQIQSLGSYGHSLGIIFQLRDDVLDYQALTEVWGKEPGDDFREGKVTLPVILAYEKATPDEKVFWQRTLAERQQNPDDFATAVRYLQRHEVFQAIEALMKEYSCQAYQSLVGYQGPFYEALVSLSSYCLDRKF